MISAKIEMKPFRQTSGYCGPASLKIILEYYGIKKSEKNLAKLTGATRAEGVQAAGIVAACKNLGFEAIVKDFADFKDIRYSLNKKNPVLVQWFLEEEGHWSVVVDIDRENIYLQDPHLGMIRAFRLKTFKKIWFDFLPPYPKKENMITRRMIVVSDNRIT
ncbi:MAG: cysteine peptidase family C39 domain-containing protein [Candidatus Aenigmatarchaeota archaeon]